MPSPLLERGRLHSQHRPRSGSVPAPLLRDTISVQQRRPEVTLIGRGFGFPKAGRPGRGGPYRDTVSEAHLASARLYLRESAEAQHRSGPHQQGSRFRPGTVTGLQFQLGAAGFNSLIKQNYSEVLRPAWSLGAQGVLHSASPGPLTLLPRQLLVELRHIIIPLRLVASASHRHPQLILAPERSHLELPSFVTGAIREDGLIAGQLLRLLVHQPHVAVQPCGEQTALQVPVTGNPAWAVSAAQHTLCQPHSTLQAGSQLSAALPALPCAPHSTCTQLQPGTDLFLWEVPSQHNLTAQSHSPRCCLSCWSPGSGAIP